MRKIIKGTEILIRCAKIYPKSKLYLLKGATMRACKVKENFSALNCPEI